MYEARHKTITTKNMNQTQGLGTVSFSLAHKKVLEKSDRKRVAAQLVLIMKKFLRRKNFKGIKILDIGCSSGIITQFIAGQGGTTIGIDVDKNAIKEATADNKDIKNLSFRLASGATLPFKDNSFDIVLCNQVYSFISNPRKMMKEIYRVLKTEGFCLFTGDNLLNPVETMYRLPFLRWLPKKLSKGILKIMGYKDFYIGNYKTYWGLLKLCNDFAIEDYTLRVLKQPEKFKFIKIKKYRKIINLIPHPFLKLLEPFLPTFIFILKKVRA